MIRCHRSEQYSVDQIRHCRSIESLEARGCWLLEADDLVVATATCPDVSKRRALEK